MSDNNVFVWLSVPFDPADLEWRAGATNQDKTKALALAYITSRAVMDRLDEVVGPENWRDEYQPGPDGGLICGLSLRVNEEWITKWDGAENTLVEEVKGGLSGAFKRAAVKWGIGRYLYKLENIWVPCEQHGRTLVLKSIPPLPAWALPDASSQPYTQNTPQSTLEETSQDDLEIQTGEDSEVDANGDDPNLISHGARSISWNANVVKALIEASLVEDVVSAVNLLNQSDLQSDTSPEDAIAWLQVAHSDPLRA